MSKRAVLLVAVAAGLVVAVLVAAFGGLAWLRGRGVPQRDGRATLDGLEAEVTVRFDEWGVPHLTGAGELDLAAALGWLHANDRFTQMELTRRVAAGRLAEVLGDGFVESDVNSRQMRYWQIAEALAEAAGAETRGWLEAYAAGVNAWLAARGDDLPPALSLLRIEPEPWTPAASMSQTVMMARDLSFWQGRPEELRWRWLRDFGPERTRDLIGEADLHLPEAIVALAAEQGPLPRPERRLAAAGDGLGGSNNWALGAGRVAGDLPLVASDPHLGFRLPAVWYQAHFRAPDYEASGMTLPGLPGVVIGRGPHVAWALTNLMLDDHDVFFERLSDDGRAVERDGEWLPLSSSRETIRSRGGEQYEIELLASDLGPLLPADPEQGLPARSLAWTDYHEADPLADFLLLARARTVEEAAAGLGGFVCPAQNLVAADDRGGLLYTVLGRLPARRTGDGRLPSPAWDPAYGWDGLAPVTSNPRVIDPEDGLLATANHDTRPEGWEGRMTAEFDLWSRARRILDLLDDRSDWTPEELVAVQADVTSPYALAVVRDLAPEGSGGYPGDAALAYGALAAWDGSMRTRGPAALFALFENELLERALGDELDLARTSGWSERRWIERLLSGGMSRDWFDRSDTDKIESRDDIVAAALERAWRVGRSRWGRDVGDWSYGELHELKLRHPLGLIPFLDRLFNRGPFEMPGSETTPAAFGGSWRLEDRPVTYGPSMRWITAAGGEAPALAVLPGGQSGHPWDPHYDDQLELYLGDRLRPAPWSERDVAAATVSTLILEP